uniref:RRM domain-containing protein n=1 Tax=Panagrellus redivivus TaxID=6233 RepID=A0A7E4UL65_PANRE
MLGCRSPPSLYSSGYESDCSLERAVADPGLFSLRVFVGGFPKGTSESLIRANYSQYDIDRVDWPHKSASSYKDTPNGFAFLEFHGEGDVVNFLADCNVIGGRTYSVFMTQTQQKLFVEVKPYRLSDARYGHYSYSPTANQRKVFLGGLPRETTAREVHDVMVKFGEVKEVIIDLLPATKYPRGTACVVFDTVTGRDNAVRNRVVLLKHPTTGARRLIEVKPFLLSQQRCEVCGKMTAPVSCYNKCCMKVTCYTCYDVVHQYLPPFGHKRIFRGSYYTPYDARNVRF